MIVAHFTVNRTGQLQKHSYPTNRFFKQIPLIALLVVHLFFSLFLQTSTARSAIINDNCTESYLRDVGTIVVNCSGDKNQCNPSSSLGFTNPVPTGQEVFVMGDSIMYGMVKLGGLLDKLSAANFSVNTAYDAPTTITVRGESVEATGGYAIQQTNRNLAIHQADIAKSNILVVGLGTNPDDLAGQSGNFTAQMKTFIETIRSYNPAISIFWINTYYQINNRAYPTYQTQNQRITDAAAEYKFSVIDAAGAISSQELIAPNAGDNIHYNATGYGVRSEWLVKALSNGLSRALTSGGSTVPTSAATGGCICPANATPLSLNLSEEERYQMTWGFFTSAKKLSSEAAAGLMGNLKAESGIDPHNMQNNAPLPDGPQMPVRLVAGDSVYPASEIEGKYGYGIAQWTSAGRQKNLIDFAAAQGKSTGDLVLQLEFLWKELTESYTSVLSVLQTPGVTVNEASSAVLLRFEIPASVILPPKGEATPESRQNTITERTGLSQGIYDRFAGSTGSFASSPSCRNTGDGVSALINPTAENQVIECAPNTAGDDITTGYVDGKPIQFRPCLIPSLGIQVNAQISAQVYAMVNDAAQEGITLTANSGFRPLTGPDSQESVYLSACKRADIVPTPGPYPKSKVSDTQSCPGAAAPGYSNHGAGYAIDFDIPQSYEAAKNNPMFKWLLANANRYGLYEWGKGLSRNKAGYEAWHWSIDGN